MSVIFVEVSVNGKVVARVGAEDMGQIFAFLCANGKLGPRSNAVVPDAERVLSLNISGATARGGRAPDEEFTYFDEELNLGDSVTIRLLDRGEPTAAIRSTLLDHERIEREEFERSKEYYFEHRDRFEEK